MLHSATVALNKCIDGFKAISEVTAIYANSMHIFVFYEGGLYKVALMDRLYAVFDAYIDDVAYSLKTIYYVPECMTDEPDDIVHDTPLLYVRDAIDRKVED